MKLPVLVAKASSYDMGGDLSHEYHLASTLGEDFVVHCDTCDYVINDELAVARATDVAPADALLNVWRGITRDRSTLINVWYPSQTTESRGSSFIHRWRYQHICYQGARSRSRCER